MWAGRDLSWQSTSARSRCNPAKLGSIAFMWLKVNGTCSEAYPKLARTASSQAGAFGWLRGLDLNQRPLGYEPNELPDCSTPRGYCTENRRLLPRGKINLNGPILLILPNLVSLLSRGSPAPAQLICRRRLVSGVGSSLTKSGDTGQDFVRSSRPTLVHRFNKRYARHVVKA